jgi:hypothetical protein
MEVNLEVVHGAGYQVSLVTEMEPPEALALEAASQELMVTKYKFQKALEARREVEFQVVLPMETEFLELPATEAVLRMEF